MTDGQNEWSKVDKSCPGWFRRGTQRRLQFPTGNITDIPLEAGNFRDYFEQVGRILGEQPHRRGGGDDRIHTEQAGDDMPTHRWAPKGFQNQFEMPGGMPVTPGDIGPARAPDLDPADPYLLLPLTQDFHIPRLKAVIHRNGITDDEIRDGYFVRQPLVELSQAEVAAYQALGIPF